MAIDTTIQFNGHNSYKVTTPVFAYPFGVQNMTYITHSFQAYANSPLASATRAKTKYFDADGAQVSEVAHAFAVTAVFGKVDITVAVPATATQAQLVLLQGGTDWWFAEPKSEEGQTSTPYNVNYAGQLTYITPNGIYTGFITASQIVVVGSVGSVDETLEQRLITINNNAINLTSTVNGVVTKTTLITSGGVYTGEIVATQITSGSISADRIASLSITGEKIANTTITGGKIVTGTITATQIAAGTITGDRIAAGTITADKINVTNLYVDTLRGASDYHYAKFFADGDGSSLVFYSKAVNAGAVFVPKAKIRGYGTSAFVIEGIEVSGSAPNIEGTTTLALLHGTASVAVLRDFSADLRVGIRKLGVDTTGFYKEVSGVKTYF